jgi:hypothetical protein
VIDMNRNLKRLSVAAALVAATAFPVESRAQSQAGWGSLGIHTGWMNPAQHAVGPTEELGFDETLGIGGSLDFWFGNSRRWGLGLEGTWSNWGEWDPDGMDDFGYRVQFATYDASLQFRLATPTATTRLLPSLSLGIGGVTANPDDDPQNPFPPGICTGGPGVNAEGRATCAYTPADVMLTTDLSSELAIVPGAALDFFLSPSVALHMEAKDYYTNDSPYVRLSNGETHEGGHNWQFTGGLAFYWGGRRVAEPGFVSQEPVVITPPPAPAPAPPPPPPPPAEEMVTMCIVDPNGFSVRTIEAISVPSENRVYVNRNGERVLFSTAYPASGPIYVRSATWYVNDQPFIVSLETGNVTVAPDQRNRLELVKFGSVGTRSAADLVFIGTIDGTPVYANRADVAPFRTRLDAALITSKDLGTIMRADAELAREIGAVDSYYVAVEPNCVFQPVSVTHFVRRTRG